MNKLVKGKDEQQRLIGALCKQYLVAGDAALAAQVADKSVVETFDAGQEIISQHRNGNDLFFILDGSVAIVVNGREVAQRSAGRHVGEMAMADPMARRSASALALERVVAARIGEPDFSRLAENSPVLWRRLAADLGNHVQRFNEYGAHLEFVAYHDPLTLLPNRNLFTERFHHALLRAQRGASGCALLYIDLDRFKPVNDSYGHAVGDQLLKLVADRIAGCLRHSDTVARFGGDEFLALLTGLNAREDAGTVASKLVNDLASPFQVSGQKVFISASVGIAFYPDHGNDVETLMLRADQALYSAKRAGRDTYRLFEG